jgi:hypothetical protein
MEVELYEEFGGSVIEFVIFEARSFLLLFFFGGGGGGGGGVLGRKGKVW